NISSEDIIKNPKELFSRSFLRSLQDLEYLECRIQQQKKKDFKRFWHPVTFYFYGSGGSRKSGLVTELFRDQLYADKPKKQRNN
ncbi:14571_t:CDS:1, partial [Racocetra persica]